ncbi:transposase [Desulfovibrio inopinatus]|uniref:transposase n=1 Tax=Desulfovibrio inopinatus TaxID=102109 RepID=UPI000688DD18|nr:transposase [Desulfovibrio inopinatus]
MPRIARLLVDNEPCVYHVMSRTALDGFPLKAAEKDHLLHILQHFSQLYFVEILGFCIMGNHFHLLTRVHPGSTISDTEICRRYMSLYGQDAVISPATIERCRHKWGSLSELMREVKQSFSRWYNARHKRRGYFWGDRFKSVIVQNGAALVHCLAYIDLNPIRAGIVKRPEDYRWSSIGYHLQTHRAEKFLSLNFGMDDWDIDSVNERLHQYRRFLYETGAMGSIKGASIPESIHQQAKRDGYEYTRTDRFLYRTRWFTDSGIIGSKEFILALIAKHPSPREAKRSPRHIAELDFYSMKQLAEEL